MNFLRVSYLDNSSDEGSPAYFYLISNIIFSTLKIKLIKKNTVVLVSPSKSDNLEFSGFIFLVSIFSSP